MNECDMSNKTKKQEIIYAVAKDLMRTYRFASFPNSSQLYVRQEDGVYTPYAEIIIKRTIRNTLKEYCTSHDVKEAIAIVKDESRIQLAFDVIHIKRNTVICAICGEQVPYAVSDRCRYCGKHLCRKCFDISASSEEMIPQKCCEGDKK